ncbi:hypothetical protein ACFL6F_03720 [Planctomycetota bacterium]
MTEEKKDYEDFSQANEDTLIDKIFKNKKRILVVSAILAVCIWIMTVKERTLHDNMGWFFLGGMFIGLPIFGVFAYLKYRKDEKQGKPKNIFTQSGNSLLGFAGRLVVLGLIFPIVYLHSEEIISMNLACVFYFLFFVTLLYIWYKS